MCFNKPWLEFQRQNLVDCHHVSIWKNLVGTEVLAVLESVLVYAASSFMLSVFVKI